MSENVRTKAAIARLPKIRKGIVDGKTYTEIAADCDVDPRTIYRDRQGIAYHEMLNDLTDQYLQGLREFRESSDPKVRFKAIQELGFQVRAMMKAAIPTKVELEGPARIVVSFDKSLEIKPEDEPETS